MKTIIKTPRILRIKSIHGFTISCIFNNGEARDIDFKKLFKQWRISKNEPEFNLLKPNEFKKVRLRNNTLSWKNINVILLNSDGKEESHPFEIDPVVLYVNSKPSIESFRMFNLGSVIRRERTLKGLSQDELASRSGTSKTYISRIENNRIEPELHTLYKIVEIGLGKKIEVTIK
jgi:DNA-binding XRE family transcriptional regulator